MKTFRSILKILFWLILVLSLVLGTVSFLLYQFKDKIIATLVGELNKELNTKVVVEKIDIDFWETFPNVSLEFNKIKMRGSFLGDDSHLLLADKILLSFNLLDVYYGKYKISKTIIENADIHLVIREDGQNNFTVLNPSDDSVKTNSTVSFNLEEITLKKVRILFENRINHQVYDLFCSKGEANFLANNKSWGVKVGGDFFVHKINIEKHDYLASREIKLNTSIIYNGASDYYQVEPSDIFIGSSLFNLEGKFGVNSGQDIVLALTGKETTIQTIVALLPKDLSQQLGVYKSEGNIYFKGVIKGKVDSHFAPEAVFDFGCNNTSFFHPDLSKKIENISFTGKYSNGKKSLGEYSYLHLNDVQGSIDGRTFTSDLEVRNFVNPYIKFNFNGSFKLGSLKQIFKFETLESLEGELKTDLFFEGYKKDLDHKSTLEKVSSYGNLEIDNCSFRTKGNHFSVQNLSTQFSFDNKAIYLHELTAKAQGQDIRLKGNLYHYLMYMAGSSNDLEGELQLFANNLDLEKLLILPEKGTTETSGQNTSIIPKEGKFYFQCDVKKVVYKKFSSSNVTGRVYLYHDVLSTNNISMKSGGGNFRFDGKLDFINPNISLFTGNAKCKDVNVDSVLYMFDNFGQTFLTKENLKGQITMDADLYVPLDNQNNILTKSLKTLLNVSIKNGELNNFEPMQKLARYVDAKELANIRFSELKNTIRIEKEVIYIPDMEIKSNLNTVGIIGTHTFAGDMDYRLRVSLKNFKKKDPDAVFGAIKEEGTNTTLFLTITGPADNCVVAYDKQAVKDKVKDSWKKEKEEFKSLFKTGSPIQNEKKKAIEVNEEEEITID